MAWLQAQQQVIAFQFGVQPNEEEITMSAFERLLAIADEETLDLARAMIGKPELALLLAKEALKNTTEVLSPAIVAEVLGISRNGATHMIENCAASERPAWDD
jgi:ABC-type ATPase involved in cell division